MMYRIVNTDAGIVVAEYQADAPKPTTEIDPLYVGPSFVTKDEQDNVVDLGPQKRTWHTWEFKRLFSREERIAIREAGKTDAVVADLLDILDSAPEVSSDDGDLLSGLAHLEEIGAIASGRADQIMKGN